MLSSLPSDPPSPRSASEPREEGSRAPTQALALASAEDVMAAAMRRLETALEALDRAVAMQTDRRAEMTDQEAEYSALQEDRSRLARALDAANGRIEILRDNQDEAARRVERARAAVRAILAASPGDS
jgi:predicted  nucleic acid-binding Zn-ribbon protein